MFSWKSTDVSPAESPTMQRCIEINSVSQVYQNFSQEDLAEDGYAHTFISQLQEKSVSVHALIGEAEWAYDASGAPLIKRLQELVTYNQSCQNSVEKIRGVVVDVEPYLLDEWDDSREAREKLMKKYLGCLSCAYQYAVQNELEFTVCIPIFYNSSCPDILESLISDNCDAIAVMNYNRSDEYGQMAHEVGLAREYGKKVICIYELQAPGKHSIKDQNTYAYEGLEALKKSAARLERQFGYSELSFAYHWYEPLKSLSGLEP